MDKQLEITKDLKLSFFTSIINKVNHLKEYFLSFVHKKHNDSTSIYYERQNTVLYYNFNDDYHTKLERCLRTMTFLQRRAFESKTFEGKKTSVICRELEINEEIFWGLIHDARQKLIKALDI